MQHVLPDGTIFTSYLLKLLITPVAATEHSILIKIFTRFYYEIQSCSHCKTVVIYLQISGQIGNECSIDSLTWWLKLDVYCVPKFYSYRSSVPHYLPTRWMVYLLAASRGEERLPVSSIRSYLHAAEQNPNKTSHVPLFAPCRHATHSTG